ncbi:ABC transporter substrate-binding protein [Marinilactibacillus psychrotolerans]|uniref:Peptide ABC transporter substrate-binding protein n=1 Tax=Marinilactibacillus psychrotolerans TaxID=191770 RepID=A0AAV3WRD3_9LACT|nr:ABC transporter substrate-binding protein [Marinilactibacillus psychrotolerans]GEL67966.1 peptide ABC transporter substrate-binding protein [Marinilactibacillus psychrotolerans]GEQ35675.1 peptide ABC transporter substrate-binding protein [Marinilactibacillus psychrotolerans]SDD29056.1 peptide/nickel transport system substrate-binding protein [Marinilactibacillus psychrotolerans]
MKKKLLSTVVLLGTMVLSACNVTTEDEATTGNTNNDQEAVQIDLLGAAADEKDLNILRDQLTRNGFEVNVNQQPDYASYRAQRDAGNFDISVASWTTVTGNPDYAVRSLFTSDGDSRVIAPDSEVDELINQAATENESEYVNTYSELENVLVTENAYTAGLYNSLKAQAFNKDLINPESVNLYKSRAFAWDTVQFNDTSLNETEPLILTQTESDLTSLDPIKGNDGSINQLNTNMYVRLVNLTEDDTVTSEASLSYDHAIAEGNTDYYFVLRDDINFTSVEDGQAVDTGERVGADDVKFSLERASDPESVPDHRTYSLHEYIDEVTVVDDMSELEDATVAEAGTSVKDALEADLDTSINSLVTDKTQADSAAGNYQVVKLTTTEPFPQVLNYLAHQSAGIVSKKQVESINTYDIENFDINTDIPYGDQRAVTEGDTYDNHLYASGPYVMIEKNDYAATFQKNPAYMPETDNAAKIKNVTVRFIGDMDSALSALRSGEVHLLYGLGETQYQVVEGEESLELQTGPSNAVQYLIINTTNEDRKTAQSEDLRKAILYSINQDDFIQSYDGQKEKAFTPVTPLVETGNELEADADLAQEHLSNYLEQSEE